MVGAKSGMLHVLACLNLAAAMNHTENSEETNKTNPNELLSSIRRKLMDQNYDYMSQESDDSIPLHTTSPPELTSGTKAIARRDALVPHVDDVYLTNVGISVVKSTDLPRTKTSAPRDDVNFVDKKDLQFLNKIRSFGRGFGEDVETTTARVKYKFIKVQNPSYRRSGSKQAYRQFIQEEGSDGVAIIRLDDEPFPEFRLPRARRQYMTDDDLDVADVTDLSAGLDGNHIDDTIHELARNRAV